MSTLYVMVGLPGSGKSTWAQANLTDAEYVSRDRVRRAIVKDNEGYFSHEDEVYDKFVDIIAYGLCNNRNMVADATHLSHGSRKKLVRALAQKSVTTDKYDITFIVMNTPITECVKRDLLREGAAQVTETVIRNMARSLSTPFVGEFDNVKEVKIINE